MDPILAYARAHEREMVALVRALVECETPSGEAGAIARFADLVGDELSGLARVKKIPGGAWGPHVLCAFRLPGRSKQGRVLALGHSPGVIAGGARTNVVAAEARAEIDVRVVRLRDAAAIDRKFRKLRPFDRRCTIEVTGGLNRPPMERSAKGARLFRLARKAAAELGIGLEESLSGGGSDGNFTAALGVPTLDGLGAVGEGAHTAEESILVERMAERTALVAKLLEQIGGADDRFVSSA